MFADGETLTPSTHEPRLPRAIRTNSIMVVDDDAQICALFEVTFRLQGFAVLTADSGQKALEILNSVVPDLFIIDMVMPDMDGMELCKTLREWPPTAKTPILLVSARYDSRMIPRAKAAGADDFVWKLMPQINLMRRVRQLLEYGSTDSPQ